jgi:hypothetical protein
MNPLLKKLTRLTMKTPFEILVTAGRKEKKKED